MDSRGSRGGLVEVLLPPLSGAVNSNGRSDTVRADKARVRLPPAASIIVIVGLFLSQALAIVSSNSV